ncbi:MAG: RuvX/YqgF family protein [bacterium]
MRYLAIDYGLSNIGLALGDSETGIASPVDVIAYTPEAVSDIQEFAQMEGVEEFVVGVPLSTNEEECGEQLMITKEFIEAMRAEGMTVHEVDERYTSSESQRMQEEEGVEVEEDALAAMLIMQAFLDERKELNTEN